MLFFKRKKKKYLSQGKNEIGLMLDNEKIWKKLKDQSLEKKKKLKQKH